MGTRADFYNGKGKDAEWLGSIAFDGYASGIQPKSGSPDWPDGGHLFEATTPEQFRGRLETFFGGRRDLTRPEMGWPWPWEDSGMTDCSYWFFDGKVWAAVGYPREYWIPAMEDLHRNYSEDEEQNRLWLESHERCEFPDMTARQNITLCHRSGLLVVGVE